MCLTLLKYIGYLSTQNVTVLDRQYTHFSTAIHTSLLIYTCRIIAVQIKSQILKSSTRQITLIS